ncbi:PIR protein [Plasmodium brasilianum]|uniref:PIR protein n=1 Tax=Plasmodium brasilianum TaxID=5824 RepID=UPI00350E58FF|nr:PIR protein [Plasmodium brasilianum]
MSTSNEDKWDKILVGSPSYNLYNKFDNNVEGDKYKDSCSAFEEKGDSSKNEGYELCRKIARNSDHLPEYSDTDKFTIHCSHYRYWAYQNIKKFLENNLGNDNGASYISKFMKARDSINQAYNSFYCQYDLRNDNATDVLKDRLEEKYLYDYFRNYDSIKSYKTCNILEFIKYKEYLEHIDKLYKKYKNEKYCCEDSWYSCPNYFNCYEGFDPTKLLSVLNSKGKKNCDNLKSLEDSLASGMAKGSSSQTDIKDSIFIFYCTDFKEELSVNGRTGERRNDDKSVCHFFPISSESRSKPSLTGVQTSTNLHFSGTVLQEQPLDSNKSRQETTKISEIPGRKDQAPPENSLEREKVKQTQEQETCPGYQLEKDAPKFCKEANVREIGTLGGRWNEYSPHKRVRFTRSIEGFYSHSLVNKTDIIRNTFFRVGIAFALAVGIIFIIFLYYKFTPFGRHLRKKPSRNKRIDDDVDISYLRQFKIRAPKTVNRNRGSTRLQFAYYSR